MDSNDETLIEALRTAGHDTAADALRDTGLARKLREAGHETLADQLDGDAPAQPEPETEPERFVRELKEASDGQWSTNSGLHEN